jgi:hypothetical protein
LKGKRVPRPTDTTEGATVKIEVAPQGAQDVRWCPECKAQTFWDSAERMVFSPSGARRMWLWQCEKHPLPEIVNDEVTA